MNNRIAHRVGSRLACHFTHRMAVAVLTIIMSAVPAQAAEVALQAVPAVDLQRYAGTWYEIARLPNKFQADCVSDVTATYTPKPDGRVEVVNRCRKKDNSIDEANGIARVVDPSTNAKLEVRFAPEWLSWLPMVWGDYWIIDLAPDYSVAAVGDPRREWLWVLARKPKMDEASYQELLNRLTAQGFDTAQLRKTTHR